MIHSICGVVKKTCEQAIVLETSIGISFSINVANAASFPTDKEAKIITYMHWNQEQGPSLFGFRSEEERELFSLIISCSGIGPKMGLSILSQMSPLTFVGAIQEGNIRALSSLHGIGTKKAEQLVVHLKHKVTKLVAHSMVNSGSSIGRHFDTIADVLTSLNYSRPEISSVFEFLRTNHASQEISFDELLRKSLSYLAKRT